MAASRRNSLKADPQEPAQSIPFNHPDFRKDHTEDHHGNLGELAARINAEHQAGEKALREGLEHFRVVGEMLLQAKNRCGHGRWLRWVAENLCFGDRQARKYMRLARKWGKLKSELGSDLSLADALRSLTEEGGGQDTVVVHNSGELEWYTPPRYIEAVRLVLGDIDLDPASCAEAQENVRATRYFSKEDDGLRQPWKGKIFLNPPYAVGFVDKFIDKLIGHFENGDVPRAIVLTNNATETRWFQHLAARATAICFPKRRLWFLHPGRKPSPPLQGQAVFGLGVARSLFCRHFGQFGLLSFPISRAVTPS
jgi:ParB family chromosome partitioning protein